MEKEFSSYHDLVSYIKNKLYKTKGIILLDHMNAKKRKYIHNLIDNIKNISSFSIGYNSTRRIVIRYDLKEDNININELINLGNISYKNKDYINCINIFKKLLANGVINVSFIYAKIGLSYIKLNNSEEALDYLIVANILNKSQNKKFNLDSLINAINSGNLYNEKEVLDMSVEDFSSSFDDFQINNVNEIIDLIITNKNTIKDICSKYNLSDEEINIIKLLIAKNYYTDSYYDIGDRYLKEVEKSKNKSKRVNKLLNEVRKNKLFYKNRNNKLELK